MAIIAGVVVVIVVDVVVVTVVSSPSSSSVRFYIGTINCIFMDNIYFDERVSKRYIMR